MDGGKKWIKPSNIAELPIPVNEESFEGWYNATNDWVIMLTKAHTVAVDDS